MLCIKCDEWVFLHTEQKKEHIADKYILFSFVLLVLQSFNQTYTLRTMRRYTIQRIFWLIGE